MNTLNIKYQKSEISIWITTIIIASFPLITIAYISKWGNHPISPLALGLVFLLLFTILILFYKLTITINDKTISAKFGIGLIKKSIELKDIELNKIYRLCKTSIPSSLATTM